MRPHRPDRYQIPDKDLKTAGLTSNCNTVVQRQKDNPVTVWLRMEK